MMTVVVMPVVVMAVIAVMMVTVMQQRAEGQERGQRRDVTVPVVRLRLQRRRGERERQQSADRGASKFLDPCAQHGCLQFVKRCRHFSVG